MNFPWGLQLSDIITWVVSLIVGVFSVIYTARVVMGYQKRKDIEHKRREVRALQPKLKVILICNYQPRFKIENIGHSPAKYISVTIDGSETTQSIDSIRAQIPGYTNYKEIKLNIGENEAICTQLLENPKLKVVFHDQWFPDQDYPAIFLPFKQEKVGGFYRPNFDTSKQEPICEQTAYPNYSNKQIVEIWERENFGNGYNKS